MKSVWVTMPSGCQRNDMTVLLIWISHEGYHCNEGRIHGVHGVFPKLNMNYPVSLILNHELCKIAK